MYGIALVTQSFAGRFHRNVGWARPLLALLFLAFVGVAAAAFVWLLVRSGRKGPVHYMPSPPTPPDPAMEVLRARFARGEIDVAEFDARAARLTGLVPSPPVPPSAPPSA